MKGRNMEERIFEQILILRTRMGMTVEQFAHAVEIPPRTFQKRLAEVDTFRLYELKRIERIAKKHGISVLGEIAG